MAGVVNDGSLVKMYFRDAIFNADLAVAADKVRIPSMFIKRLIADSVTLVWDNNSNGLKNLWDIRNELVTSGYVKPEAFTVELLIANLPYEYFEKNTSTLNTIINLTNEFGVRYFITVNKFYEMLSTTAYTDPYGETTFATDSPLRNVDFRELSLWSLTKQVIETNDVLTSDSLIALYKNYHSIKRRLAYAKRITRTTAANLPGTTYNDYISWDATATTAPANQTAYLTAAFAGTGLTIDATDATGKIGLNIVNGGTLDQIDTLIVKIMTTINAGNTATLPKTGNEDFDTVEEYDENTAPATWKPVIRNVYEELKIISPSTASKLHWKTLVFMKDPNAKAQLIKDEVKLDTLIAFIGGAKYAVSSIAVTVSATAEEKIAFAGGVDFFMPFYTTIPANNAVVAAPASPAPSYLAGLCVVLKSLVYSSKDIYNALYDNNYFTVAPKAGEGKEYVANSAAALGTAFTQAEANVLRVTDVDNYLDHYIKQNVPLVVRLRLMRKISAGMSKIDFVNNLLTTYDTPRAVYDVCYSEYASTTRTLPTLAVIAGAIVPVLTVAQAAAQTAERNLLLTSADAAVLAVSLSPATDNNDNKKFGGKKITYSNLYLSLIPSVTLKPASNFKDVLLNLYFFKYSSVANITSATIEKKIGTTTSDYYNYDYRATEFSLKDDQVNEITEELIRRAGVTTSLFVAKQWLLSANVKFLDAIATIIDLNVKKTFTLDEILKLSPSFWSAGLEPILLVLLMIMGFSLQMGTNVSGQPKSTAIEPYIHALINFIGQSPANATKVKDAFLKISTTAVTTANYDEANFTPLTTASLIDATTSTNKIAVLQQLILNCRNDMDRKVVWDCLFANENTSVQLTYLDSVLSFTDFGVFKVAQKSSLLVIKKFEYFITKFNVGDLESVLGQIKPSTSETGLKNDTLLKDCWVLAFSRNDTLLSKLTSYVRPEDLLTYRLVVNTVDLDTGISVPNSGSFQLCFKPSNIKRVYVISDADFADMLQSVSLTSDLN